MRLGFETVESIVCLTVEIGILIWVIWGVIIEIKTDKKIDMQLKHTLSKYQRFKNKKLEDKIKEL